jgi:hypothetical protein
MEQLSTFITDIAESIEKLNQRKNTINGLKEWTIAVKKTLIDIAEKYNLQVSCKIPDEKYKNNENLEWLYDLLIYTRQDNGIFDEVFLVCESEWDKNIKAILWDFEKLLFARAKVRLMVFQVNDQNYNEYKRELINIIEKSGLCLKGDIYLFAIWHAELDGFRVEKYIKGEYKDDKI